jgi:hypothetical protein
VIFLAIRCSKELAGPFSLKSKVPRFFSEFSSISAHRNFLEFLIQILIRIWTGFYKKGCPSSQALSNHILFPIFGAREDTF